MKDINLLPKPRQQEFYYATILQSVLMFLWISLASFVIVFGAQLGVKLYLEQKAKSIGNEITQLQGQVNKEQNAKIKQEIETYNKQISDYESLASAMPQWSQVFKAFAPLPPAGIKINSFNIDVPGKKVSISGYSPTRELVLTLYNNILRDKKDFYGIDYPLENLVKDKEVNFHYSFSIQDVLLSKQVTP